MKNKSFIRINLLIFGLLSTPALGASSYLDSDRVLFERPTTAEQLDLIKCFTTGNCKQDDKIRIYPMPCEGSGSNDCTGCYEMRGGSPIRVGDLNSIGSCVGVGSEHIQKLRVFVGYEQSCPNASPSCADGQLLLSCRITSEGAPGVGESTLGYNQDCFSGRTYVRRANAPEATITILPSSVPGGPIGCAPGTTGTHPNCIPCNDTSYKATSGGAACTMCVAPTIENADYVFYTTVGTTKTSVNDCRVQSFSCRSGYRANPDDWTCAPVVIPSPAPSPTPSPTPSPAPTPTPTPAPSSSPPPNCTLFETFVNMTASVTKHTLVSNPPTWNPSYLFTWNKNNFPIYGPEDFFTVSISVQRVGKTYQELLAVVKSYPLTRINVSFIVNGSLQGGSPTQPGPVNSGDTYFVHADYRVSGQYCRRISISAIAPFY